MIESCVLIKWGFNGNLMEYEKGRCVFVNANVVLHTVELQDKSMNDIAEFSTYQLNS
jgi:hypothetical protein